MDGKEEEWKEERGEELHDDRRERQKEGNRKSQNEEDRKEERFVGWIENKEDRRKKVGKSINQN